MCEITGLLEKVCGTNPAGYAEIALFNKKDIDSIPAAAALTGIITGDIVMKATKKGFAIPFTEETGEFDETLDGDVDAQTVKPMVKFTVTGRKAATIKQVQGMVGGRYLAIITFLDGQRVLVGSMVTPLRLRKADFKSGAYGSNTRKGLEFELGASSAIYAQEYTGAYDTIVEVGN